MHFTISSHPTTLNFYYTSGGAILLVEGPKRAGLKDCLALS